MYSRNWLIAALAACLLASACSQFNTNLSIQTSSSTLTFVSPSTATIGSIPPTGLPITATGTGFVSTGTYILWNAGQTNQIQLTNTVFVSSTQLTAVVPASAFTTAGTVQVAIQIPGSAVSGSSSTSATTTTEVSNVVNFTVNGVPGPAPTISSLSASTTSIASTPYCALNSFTLTVNGTNFTSGAVVNWNSSQYQATVVSPTQLTAVISPADMALPGIVNVSVSTSTGTSSASKFTLTTPQNTTFPAPSVTSLSPASITAGSSTFTLMVTGSSLLPCSVVYFGSDAQTTTYIGTTQLNATIPASEVFSSGGTAKAVNVTVSTPQPGGGVSAPFIFTINP